MITMVGHDRSFEVPRAVRAAVPNVNHPILTKVREGRVTAWDMVQPVIATSPRVVREWADQVVQSVITASALPGREALDCTDCEDTGFYGLPDAKDPDILRSLLRREGDGLQILTASGSWEDWSGPQEIEVIDLEMAEVLSGAVVRGSSGVARRYFSPLAFLAPSGLIAAIEDGLPDKPTGVEADGWFHYAIVDELDTGAILQLIRLKAGPVMERYEQQGSWVEDKELLAKLTGVAPPPLVELDQSQLDDVLNQIDSSAEAEPGATDTEAPADDSEAPVGDTAAPETASGALVADAPLTVSPDPRAEKLRRYWSTGKGGLKIRWNTPGDWKRCVKQLTKHMGVRAKGYCANLHKRNTGVWTGSKLNASAAMMVMSTEEALVASVRAGSWTGHSERVLNMTGIKDGIYEETVNGKDRSVVRALTAGGFPVEPPEDWFQDPQLASLTPLTVEDNGHVYGHLASFDMPHIGLPGKVRAPKSRSGYQWFKTGALRTASGTKVSVGQLTSVGGHAPLSADASKAVKHYDDTNSAVADVNVGEDRHGIWFAGALRPDVTPAKLRAFMASALSGDWRPINGDLELVAACSVNVPGFPIARAMAAGGAIVSLVAAGARPIALKQFGRASDDAVSERLDALEALLADAIAVMPAQTQAVPAGDVTVDIPAGSIPEAGGVGTLPGADAEEKPVNDAVKKAREAVKARKRAALRERVHGEGKADANPKAPAPLTEQTGSQN